MLKSKNKDSFDPLEFIQGMITDPKDPGYVTIKELDVYEVLDKHPTTTFHQRKKVMDKIQRKYDKMVKTKRIQNEMRVDLSNIYSNVAALERQSVNATHEISELTEAQNPLLKEFLKI